MARRFIRRVDMPYNVNYQRFLRKWLWSIILLVLIVIGVVTMIYTVPTDSEGVVKQFGKYVRTTEPGIHVKIPFWIESATAVPVKKIQKQEFGFRTIKGGVDSQYLGVTEIQSGRANREDLARLIRESGEGTFGTGTRDLTQMAKAVLQNEYIMLTGDLNIVDVEWIVQYKIKNAQSYLFNIRNPVQTIRDASQAVMRQLVGNGSVDEAITIGRIEYQNAAEEGLQQILDEYETGIQVVTVKLQSSNPPVKVRPAFNEVNKSLQQKEQRINEALKDYNQVIPKARGEAKKVIETAKGYAAERVNQAQGDASKFEKILAEYKKAPDITRQRLYFEAMSELLPKISEKWIIEQGGADGGILMKLDLEGNEKE